MKILECYIGKFELEEKKTKYIVYLKLFGLVEYAQSENLDGLVSEIVSRASKSEIFTTDLKRFSFRRLRDEKSMPEVHPVDKEDIMTLENEFRKRSYTVESSPYLVWDWALVMKNITKDTN